MTLAFTDALLSPIGLSVLSGAGLFHGKTLGVSHFHMASLATMKADGSIDLEDAIADYGRADKDITVDKDDENNTPSWKTGDYLAKICVTDAPIYIMTVGADDATENDDTDVTGALIIGNITVNDKGTGLNVANAKLISGDKATPVKDATNVMVDYYVDLPGDSVYEADITTDEFAGYYYVEASVLVRDQATGKDLPGNLTIPNAKLQSNFTITMASTGDASTFDFTLDAFPAYTYFDKTKKVLCVVQIAKPGSRVNKAGKPVMPHNKNIEHEDIVDFKHDSNSALKDATDWPEVEKPTP